MARKVLPSKLVTERILVVFDFLNELAWGETLDIASIEVKVEVGVDALPSEMLYKAPIVVNGRYVYQQVYGGVPGVIYQVKCTARTVENKPLERFVRIAILPDNAQLPLFAATYLTSRPYPIQDIEGLSTIFEIEAANLSNKFIGDGPEGFSTILTLQEGTLVGGRETYDAPPEDGIDTVFMVVSMDLFGGIVTGIAPPEAFVTALLPLTGTLVGGRVAYDNEVEGFTTSFTPLSGTLS